MALTPSRNAVAGLGVVFLTAIVAAWLTGAVAAERIAEFAGLVLAAMLTAGLSVQTRALADRAIMPPAFVIVFAALLLFGPGVATLVALAASIATSAIARTSLAQTAIEASIVLVAVQSAGSFKRWPGRCRRSCNGPDWRCRSPPRRSSITSCRAR